ncbi:hypothetical protein ACA910_009457 [Epithemia clementina (nom. ined.)]
MTVFSYGGRQVIWLVAILSTTTNLFSHGSCSSGNRAMAFLNGNLGAPSSSCGGRTTVTSKLYARASLLPPPPPPPPPQPVFGGGDESNLVSELWRSLQDAVSLPDIPSVPNMDANNMFSDIVRNLDQLPQKLDVGSSIQTIRNQLDAFDEKVLAQLNDAAKQLQEQIVSQESSSGSSDAVRVIFQKVSHLLLESTSELSPTVAIFVSAVVSYVSINALLTWGQPPPPSQPYPLNKYDPIAARAYFDQRLPMVLARGLQIFVQSLQFGLDLLKDKLDNKIAANENLRGRQLAQLLTKLGPTFIKVGQSLSIRTDLLSPAYQRGLATLQDQVTAFDTGVAKQIMEAEWGRPVNSVIDELPAKPVAAASLGQVYKAKLKGSGQVVAIKVQRPDIMEQIALDMHLLREFAPIAKRTFNLNSDTVGTVDAWGSGFVDELDYIQEAANAEFFSEQVQKTPLKEVVLAPKVVQDFTTPQVLVTEWIDGQRLDRSSADDVTILCSIAMNTYLTMMLEMGVLHCDPHPGNLLRTPDGRLCILDWGMVTRIDKDIQIKLIEHMAHLTSADYAEIPKDLLLLGFIPDSKKELIRDSGVVELLTEIYGTWTGGGGAAAFNVNEVITKLQDLTAEKGNLFQIPPYFAYIAKSFSVLEGIGLSNDPKYSIVMECLPYVSKRLLTDKEKCGPALSTFIFGPEKHKVDRIVDYNRVEQLIEGFGEYTTSASGAMLGKQNVSRVELLDDSADEILDLVFSEEESPLQEIIVDQLAKIVASSGRSLLSQLRERSGVLPSGRTVLGVIVDPLGLFRTSPLVRPNELDQRTVETTIKIVELMQRQADSTTNPMFNLRTLSREEAFALSTILVRKFWQRRNGVFQTSNRFLRRSLELIAEQLERGERDSRLLPAREIAPSRQINGEASNSRRNGAALISPANGAAPDSSRTSESQGSSSETGSSKRLQDARRILEGIQDDATLAPELASFTSRTHLR